MFAVAPVMDWKESIIFSIHHGGDGKSAVEPGHAPVSSAWTTRRNGARRRVASLISRTRKKLSRRHGHAAEAVWRAIEAINGEINSTSGATLNLATFLEPSHGRLRRRREP